MSTLDILINVENTTIGMLSVKSAHSQERCGKVTYGDNNCSYHIITYKKTNNKLTYLEAEVFHHF